MTMLEDLLPHAFRCLAVDRTAGIGVCTRISGVIGAAQEEIARAPASRVCFAETTLKVFYYPFRAEVTVRWIS